MIGVLGLGAAVVAFLVIWHFKGGATASLAAILAGCALTTIQLVSLGESTAVAAVAPPTVTIASFHLALLGGLIVMPRQVLGNVPAAFWLFLVLVVVVLATQGPVMPHTVSGVVHWASVILAWGVGAAVSFSAVSTGRPSDRTVAMVIAFIIAWHAALAVMQLVGLRAVSSVDVGASEIARVSGSAGNSGNLGKLMFLLIVLLLPVSRSRDVVARRWAIVGIAVAALLTGLSYSRANAVAVGVLLVLWLLLGPGMRMANRLLVPLVIAIVALPIIDVLILRSEYDPDGGSRPALLTTAVNQISETLWLGVGPNNYLYTVGQYDAYAAGGLPVHSAFLLALAELGLVCCVILVIPLINAVGRSLGNLRTADDARLYATAVIAAIPGICVIAGTGWGLLRGQFLILLFFVLGYMVSAQRTGRTTDARSIELSRRATSRRGALARSETHG